RALAARLMEHGFDIVSGGTDTHLMLVDLRNRGELTGKQAEEALGHAAITVNKNTVPGEQRSPFVTSGIRVGSAAMTTRGMKEADMRQIGDWMAQVLAAPTDEPLASRIAEQVRELCD